MTDHSEITPNLIDVKAVFAAKNPRLLKLIPGFFFTLLKRIIHQDKINGYIYNHRDKYGLDFVAAMIGEFGVNIEVDKRHSVARPLETNDPDPMPGKGSRSLLIPPEGRFILAANHPLGGLDGMAFLHVAGAYRKDVIFPVNDLLMFVPGLRPLFIPINKHGKNTENVEVIHRTFASDKTILYFPAGLVSRKQKGGAILDLEWKKTFITQAKRYQRDIIPVYISGKNTNFFYSLARWRKKLGIKSNIEMLFLPDEMMRQKNKTIRIIFGEPVSWTTFDRSKTDLEWAEVIKGKVYELNSEIAK
jgi:1-acyl-sn-glycerol-3-phosphate acyltransferase